MLNIKLKESNLEQIKAFFQTKCRSNDIQGSKLHALYELIQKKGVTMEVVERYDKFKGCKALHIGDGFYIALKHTPINKNSFFPCKLDQIYMQEL